MSQTQAPKVRVTLFCLLVGVVLAMVAVVTDHWAVLSPELEHHNATCEAAHFGLWRLCTKRIAMTNSEDKTCGPITLPGEENCSYFRHFNPGETSEIFEVTTQKGQTTLPGSFLFQKGLRPRGFCPLPGLPPPRRNLQLIDSPPHAPRVGKGSCCHPGPTPRPRCVTLSDGFRLRPSPGEVGTRPRCTRPPAAAERPPLSRGAAPAPLSRRVQHLGRCHRHLQPRLHHHGDHVRASVLPEEAGLPAEARVHVLRLRRPVHLRVGGGDPAVGEAHDRQRAHGVDRVLLLLVLCLRLHRLRPPLPRRPGPPALLLASNAPEPLGVLYGRRARALALLEPQLPLRRSPQEAEPGPERSREEAGALPVPSPTTAAAVSLFEPFSGL